MKLATLWKFVVAAAAATLFVRQFNVDATSPGFLVGVVANLFLLAASCMFVRSSRALKAAGRSGWAWPTWGWLVLGFGGVSAAEALVKHFINIDPYGTAAQQGLWVTIIFFLIVMSPVTKPEQKDRQKTQ